MIVKSEKLTKQQLIKNLQTAKIDKVEVFEGFRNAMEAKSNIDAKAIFQFSIPATTAGIISSGVVFSTQYTIGSTGSENSASGFFFSSLHLLIKAKLG